MKFANTEDALKYVQTDILREIDRICNKHDLRYYLAYGTLIGAVRHKGFIPWDDDIDIMMPYEDMLKFAEICKTELGEKYFYQSPETEKEYRLTINRVRRNGSVLSEPALVGKKVHQGIMVDIYPLFGAEEGKIKRLIQVIRAMKRALYMLDEPVRNHGTLMKIGSSFLLKIKTAKGKETAAKRLTARLAKKTFDSSEYVTVLDSGIKEMSTTYKKEWFGPGVKAPFGEEEFSVPCDADAVLRKYFGDYTVLPPEEERKYHHDYLEIVLPEDVEIEGGKQ